MKYAPQPSLYKPQSSVSFLRVWIYDLCLKWGLKKKYWLHFFFCWCMCVWYICRFPQSGNQELAQNLAHWVFHQKGVLRVGKVTHHRTGQKEPDAAYIINQEIVSGHSTLASCCSSVCVTLKGGLGCLLSPPAWNLRGFIWFPFPTPSLVFEPSPLGLSVISLQWAILLTFYQKVPKHFF